MSLDQLRAFLHLRIGEDEALAHGPVNQALADGEQWQRDELARLRAEVDAKWQLLAAGDDYTLRVLASIYDDHPDYDPAWATDA